MADLEASIRAALSAQARINTLTHGLNQSARYSDVIQVSSGIRFEVSALKRHLEEALSSLLSARTAAVGDRPGKVRNDAGATSRATARRIIVKSGSMRTAILLHLFQDGPQTDFELQRDVPLRSSTERPRRGELVDAGLVYATDGTKQHLGEAWTVWNLTALGFTVVDKVLSGGIWETTIGDQSVIPATSTETTEPVPETLF